METPTAKEVSRPAVPEDFSNAFILKGNNLQVRIKENSVQKPVPKSFRSEKEFQDLILRNGDVLFGADIILLDGKKVQPDFLEGYFFPAFIANIKNPEKPRFYIAEVAQSNKNFIGIFMRMTRIFSLFKSEENRRKLADAACEALSKDKTFKKRFKEGADRIINLLNESIRRKPDILLVTDTPWEDFSSFMEAYTDTWGSMVKSIVLRKYSAKGENILTMQPSFTVIQNGKAKASGQKEKIAYTEDHHTGEVSEDVRTVYEILKSEMLSKDSTLQFNPQKYYISARKAGAKNLAFFHLRRKNLYLVVMCPEKQVRKAIKHQVIKSLPPSVQKFWNGESTGLVIEGTKYLSELINLLKKLVAGA